MDASTEPAGEPSDEALVARCAAGDRAAFDALVDRHGAALYRFARRRCGGSGQAEDAVQDGLLAAWRGASTFRGEAAARTWLFQVVLHACRRGSRRRAGEPDLHHGLEEAEDLPATDPAADARVDARRTARALEQALAGLPDDSREVLLLRDVEGLSGEEAADVLGITLAAMKSRLHRGRLELKERLESILARAPGEESP
jgi:RNA polymerase sigma-70 factor (ECF subfamily)